MPNCLERHSLCTEANWGLPTQHFQKGIVWVSIKNIKKKKKTPIIFKIDRSHRIDAIHIIQVQAEVELEAIK